MTAPPDMPHTQYALQSQGDVHTLLSWLGVDVNALQGNGQGGGQSAPPPDMPHTQFALQTQGDVNTLLSQLGVDVNALQSSGEESESESTQ